VILKGYPDRRNTAAVTRIVHPDSLQRQSGASPSKAMVGNVGGSLKESSHHKNTHSLMIQTEHEDHQDTPHRIPSATPTPNGVRGSRDLRSPGVRSTPMGAQAVQFPDNKRAVPDFITQTDASGRATTARSAQAIEGARKVHPSGPKPKLHINKNGKLSEDKDNDDNESKDMAEETCDSIVDSIRFMCCCTVPGDSDKAISGKETQDSDDNSHVKLLGPQHPEDSGKKCLVLDLDETLVHSSFRAVPGADFVIPVQVRTLVHRLCLTIMSSTKHILASAFCPLALSRSKILSTLYTSLKGLV
jgi:NLI interacting factor-like phosphatase